MYDINSLRASINELEKKLAGMENDIAGLEESTREIITTLKDDSVPLDSPVWDTLLAKGVPDLSFSNGEKENHGDVNGIIDYSVTMDDLSLIDTITIGGKAVNIYSSSKTDAVYVISNGLNRRERKELLSEMKNHLSNDEMAIVTYSGDCYHYELGRDNNDHTKSLKKLCTDDYSLVGKTEEGKMYCFQTIKKNEQNGIEGSEIVVDDGFYLDTGKGNSTLMAICNGMVISNKMRLTMETDTKLKINAAVKEKTEGGQRVTAFTRLVFSSGVRDSAGNEYGTVNMIDGYEKYAYNGLDVYDDTKIYDEPGMHNQVDKKYLSRVVYVGDGPSSGEDYLKGKSSVGQVDSTIIPLEIQSGNTKGAQTIQGTVCYFYEGNRSKKNGGSHGSKDIFFFSQHVEDDWSNPNIFY